VCRDPALAPAGTVDEWAEAAWKWEMQVAAGDSFEVFAFNVFAQQDRRDHVSDQDYPGCQAPAA